MNWCIVHMELFLFVLPFFVLISWTISNSLIKGGLKSMDSGTVALLIVSMGLIPIFVYFIVFHNATMSLPVLMLGMLSGILIASGYILFYRGLGVESLSSAGVTLNIQQIIVILIAIFFLAETGSLFEYMGIGCIVIGAILVTIQNAPARRKYLMIAGLANIVWGLYYLPLSESIMITHLGSIPLFLGRLFGTLVILGYEAITSTRGKGLPTRKSLFIVGIAGIFDGLGNVFYSIAIQDGVFITSGAIVALVPATLALIGFIYYKDRITPLKVLGIVTSVIGALIISVL